jgi:hypothetical protein
MRGAAPGKKDPASHLASISAFAHHAAQQCNYLIQPSSSSRQYLTAWRRQGQRLDAAPQHLPRISPAALASFPSAPRPGHLRRVVGAHRGVGLAPQPVGDHPLGELQEGWRRAPPPRPRLSVYAATANGHVPRVFTAPVWLLRARLAFGPRLRGGVSSGRGDGLLDTARRRQMLDPERLRPDARQLRLDFNSMWRGIAAVDIGRARQTVENLLIEACSISPLSQRYLISPVPRQPAPHHHLPGHDYFSTSTLHKLISPVLPSHDLTIIPQVKCQECQRYLCNIPSRLSHRGPTSSTSTLHHWTSASLQYCNISSVSRQYLTSTSPSPLSHQCLTSVSAVPSHQHLIITSPVSHRRQYPGISP